MRRVFALVLIGLMVLTIAVPGLAKETKDKSRIVASGTPGMYPLWDFTVTAVADGKTNGFMMAEITDQAWDHRVKAKVACADTFEGPLGDDTRAVVAGWIESTQGIEIGDILVIWMIDEGPGQADKAQVSEFSSNSGYTPELLCFGYMYHWYMLDQIPMFSGFVNIK